MTAAEIPTHYIAFCDYCRSAKTFSSERARDLWERCHGHQEDYSDE